MNKRIKLYIIFLLKFFFKYVSCQTIYNCSTNSSCGCSANSAILTKIVGGEPAASQTWGWAASLRYTSTGSHFCGGSIISESYILTAAHCTIGLSSPSAVTVYVGSIYLSVIVQASAVSNIYIHPNYSSSTYINDISILKLSSPLNFNQPGIDEVCLPNVSAAVLATEEYPLPNTNLVAIGWGYTSEGSGTVSNVLQQVTIQAIAATSSYCQNSQITDPSIQFCAGIMPGGGKDTCQGDSGGPLMMFDSNNVWEVVGITSYGYGCAEPYYPGVYTRVAAYESWINTTISKGSHHYFIPSTILIALFLLNLF